MGMEGDYRKEHSKKKRPYSMFLLKTTYNWADEIDFDGICVMRPAEYIYLVREIKAIEYPIEVGVGSNQYIDFESADEVLKKFKVEVITAEHAEFLKKFICSYGEFGFTPWGALSGMAPAKWYKDNPRAEEESK